MRPPLRSPIAVLVLALSASSAPAQLQQTLPLGFDAAEANSVTNYPFNDVNSQKWHWVYDASNFVANRPILIQAIEMRPDGGTAFWGPATFDNVEVLMGASRNDYTLAAYDQVFDANWRAGAGTLFYSGQVIVPAATGGASPSPWSIRIDAPTPFFYDPTAGDDLIIQIRTPGSGAGNPLLHLTDAQRGAPGVNLGNRYGHLTDANAAAWTFNNDEMAVIVRITYAEAPGLFANFDASPTSGATPLTVNFADLSVTSDPGGVRSWAWDFDGDGITDSTLQNPSFTYGNCGRHSVTLTVTDATHAPSTRTKNDLVIADPQLVPVADFSAAPRSGSPPLLVQFTDTSLGAPTAWSWDLDGDGATDSTVQNPSFTYASLGQYAVSLTATNSCGSSTETRAGFIAVVANDDCAGALPLAPGLNGPFDSTGVNSSPPAWACSTSAGSDLWFTYTAAFNGSVTLDTCTGTGFDTVIELFTGSCGQLTPLACNDDSACGLQSSLTVTVSAGQVLYLRVGGYNAVSGVFHVDVTEIPYSSNDECTSAVPIFLGPNGPYDSTLATTSQPPWNCANGGSDLWYSFTAPCGLTLTAHTCDGTSYDTCLELFDGSCSNLNWIACNDDSCGTRSSLTFQATSGATYYLRVGGYNGATGIFTLTLDVGGNGLFNSVGPGCGATTLSASGSPNIGGFVDYAMGNVVGAPMLWLGLFPLGTPLCPSGCPLGTDLGVIFPASSLSSPIPCDPSLVGGTFYVQGADLGAPGGCPSGTPFPFPITVTQTIATTIG